MTPEDNNISDEEAHDEVTALETTSPSILEGSDIVVWPDNEDRHVYTPPPHLAARFYHSSKNRRKSSAASSRRNSISSSHSHYSNRSFRRNSCTRSSIDQQLRRASILESRKARLADRAAHVEQVRLRAQLAKAAPKFSNTEEKALAAKQAREKYLAKVAAACAEEVNRSKRIAEEMKEKKAAEERRYRQEVEEKHAEAERRRQEQRKTPRKPRASVATAEEPKIAETVRSVLDREKAAKRIQRCWRKARKRKIVKNFQNLNVSIDRVKEFGFQEATDLLSEENVIDSCGKVMSLLGLENGSSDDKTPIRTFLSAFMILGHPNDVFNKKGSQEQDLIGKAKDVLISFESILSEIMDTHSASSTATELQTLSQAHTTYLTAFGAWKSQDATILIETMVNQFVAYDDIWQSVKDSRRGLVARDYESAIREQQVILLAKLNRLAGHERAQNLIRTAIRDNRRQRRRRRPAGDVRPRPLNTAGDESNPGSNTGTSAENAVNSFESESQQPGQDSERKEIAKVFSAIPSNRILVHELLIDPTYKVEASPARTHLNRTVCDSMRQAVAAGQSEAWTLAIAENIRTRLLKLLKPEKAMYQLLSEALDQEHIRNQCSRNMFSYSKFFSFMADILPKLCAPVRDPEVQALAERLNAHTDSTDEMIEKLFELLHVIDLLSLDFTNYMIQQAAPTLIQQGQGYEQRQFQSDLETGLIGLERTRRWWRNASVNLLTELGTSDVHLPQNNSGSTVPTNNTSPATSTQSNPNFTRTYALGLTDLAFSTGVLHPSAVPETLGYDQVRLSKIRQNHLRFTVVGGVLLTAKNLLKRDVRSQWKQEAKRIHDIIKTNNEDSENEHEDKFEDVASRITATITSSHSMPSGSIDQLSSIILRFLQQIYKPPYVITDPLLKLLMQRLKSHIFHRLVTGLSNTSSVERVRAAGSSSEALLGLGLGEFLAAIGEGVEELSSVGRVDLGSHVDVYRSIEGEESTPAVGLPESLVS